MDLYAENILDHSKHPRNTGRLAKATVTHAEENLSCGDSLTLDLAIDGGKIVSVRWEGTGCAISQAGMSLLSEELAGMPLKDAGALTKDDVLALLGVPVGTRRMKCALLGLHTLKNALRIHQKEKPESWTATIDN
jgi:nitrogen fixation NifU-like protein